MPVVEKLREQKIRWLISGATDAEIHILKPMIENSLRRAIQTEQDEEVRIYTAALDEINKNKL